MNKFVQFLYSLFLPRKMVKHANMNFFIALLLFLMAALLNIATGNMQTNKEAAKRLGFPEIYENLPEKMEFNELPNLSVTYADNLEIEIYEDDKLVKKKVSGKYLKSDKNGTFHKVFDVDGKNLDVTIAIESQIPSKFGTVPHPFAFENFDFEGYIKQEKKENTEYVLYVFCMDQIYYLYNLEQDAKGNSTKQKFTSYITEDKDQNAYQYFLPADETELAVNEYGDLDTRKWSRKVSMDDQIDFTVPAEFESFGKIVPANRHQANILHALWGGQFTFANFDEFQIDINEIFKDQKINTNFELFLQQTKEGMVLSDSSMLRFMNLMYSVISTVFFPLLFVLIVWLMSKSFVMRKFKNYYNIAALTYFHASIIALFVGIFCNYSDYALPILILGTGYFLFATIRINTMKVDDDNPEDKDGKPKEEEKKQPIQYKRVESDATRIG